MSLLFEAHDEPITARPDYWQTVVGEMLCPLELRIRDARDVPDSLLVRDAGAVRVAELTAGRAGSAARTQAHVRRSDPELYKIDVQAQGYGVVEQGSPTRARLSSAVLDLLATALAAQLGRPEHVPANVAGGPSCWRCARSSTAISAIRG